MAYEGESVYNYLQVKESERDVILSTNVLFGVQSILKKEDGLTGMYYDYAMMAPFMAGVEEEKELEVLILGMGTGTYATQCARFFDNVRTAGVEIDEKITRLSYEYFELPGDIPVTTYDGRAYLNVDEKKYDVIMVDAYQDITIPFQMSSVEFFTLVKEHLTKDGVMVVNMNMRGQEEGNINQYLSDTIAEVFGNVYTVDVAGGTNRELFASDSGEVLARADRNIESLKTKAAGGEEREEELADMMVRVRENLIPYEKGGYLLTDDKAPVELLGMQVIDDLIGDEVQYYKGIYEEEGIEGLLRHL